MNEASMTQRAPNVHLHIERLVLDGLPLAPHEARLFRSSFERELVHLLRAHEFSADAARGSALRALPPIEAPLPAGMPARPAGRQFAVQLYESLAKSALPPAPQPQTPQQPAQNSD